MLKVVLIILFPRIVPPVKNHRFGLYNIYWRTTDVKSCIFNIVPLIVPPCLKP